MRTPCFGELGKCRFLQTRAFGERREQHRAACGFEHRLLLVIQSVPFLLIDQELEHRLRLVPARHIDDLGVVLETLALIDGGGEELGAIDLMLVEGLADLAAGNEHGRGAERATSLCRQGRSRACESP